MLDINTPRGQKTLDDERRCIEIVEASRPGWTFIITPKSREAAVDGVLVFEGTARAIVEQKSRYDVSLDEFISRYENEWLVTFEKILKARTIAEMCCVPLVGILYIVRDDTVLTQPIWSPEKGWQTSFAVRKTRTQATVNGGKALRDNAYIDMSNAKIFAGNGGKASRMDRPAA